MLVFLLMCVVLVQVTLALLLDDYPFSLEHPVANNLIAYLVWQCERRTGLCREVKV